MRKAVSLIELVFAIVIMGIAAMSFPLILTQTSSNNEMALQQEAILNAKAYAGTILSYPWDGNSVSATDGRVMVLDTTGTLADNEFDVGVDNTRVGHIVGIGRRAVLIDDNTGLPVQPASSGGIDDFDGDARALPLAATVATDLDYILNFSLAAAVNYVSDNANYGGAAINNFNFQTGDAGGTTNIKMIQVSATNAAGNTITSLRAYSSNIGDYVLLEKENW